MNSQALNYHIKQMARNDFNSTLLNNKTVSQPKIGNYNMINNNIPSIIRNNSKLNNYPTNLREYKPNREITDKITNIGKLNYNNNNYGLTYDEVLMKKENLNNSNNKNKYNLNFNSSKNNSNNIYNNIGNNNNTYNPFKIGNELSDDFDKANNKIKSNKNIYSPESQISNDFKNINISNINDNRKNLFTQRDNRLLIKNWNSINNNAKLSDNINCKSNSINSSYNNYHDNRGRKSITTEYDNSYNNQKNLNEVHNQSYSKNKIPKLKSNLVKSKQDLINTDKKNYNNSLADNIKPITSPYSNLSVKNNYFSVRDFSMVEEQNAYYRNYMEDFSKSIDKFMNNPHLGLFTLYDGHGGVETSMFVNNKMPEFLADNLKSVNDFNNTSIVERAISTSFEQVNNLLATYPWSEFTGSTGCLVLVYKNDSCAKTNQLKYKIYSANAGDSRTVLVDYKNNKVNRLSYDHKATDYSEIMRIKSRGGYVFNGRVLGQLAVTRAFGDLNLKSQGIIPTPYMKNVDICTDSIGDAYLIIASDGIWDVLEDEELLDICYKNTKTTSELAKSILNNVLKRGSFDNCSIIVVAL